jgi:PLP dependent protein
MGTIAENLGRFRDELAAECRRCGRDPGEIRVVAVTKTQDPPALTQLAACGIHAYGENRIDHLASMRADAPPTAHFHFIGRLQRRQIKHLVALVECLHSLDDPAHAARLESVCAAVERRLAVFCQVNADGEPQKGGCAPEDLGTLLDAVRACPHLDLLGLMCMAPDLTLAKVGQDRVSACFERTRQLAKRHGLDRLSMGMSGDWRLAVTCGATDLRIGTVLFA